MKKIVLFVVIAVAAFTACKKDKTERQPTTQEKIMGRWRIDKEISKAYSSYNDTFYENTTTGGEGDYAEFRSDQKFLFSFGTNSGTATYSLKGDSTIQLVFGSTPPDIDTTIYSIKTLTNTALVLYQKRWENNGEDYEEQTLEMKK